MFRYRDAWYGDGDGVRIRASQTNFVEIKTKLKSCCGCGKATHSIQHIKHQLKIYFIQKKRNDTPYRSRSAKSEKSNKKKNQKCSTRQQKKKLKASLKSIQITKK
jgi:hypothetical protein